MKEENVSASITVTNATTTERALSITDIVFGRVSKLESLISSTKANTAEQNKELFRQYKETKEQKFLDALVLGNLKLIACFAMKYRRCWQYFEDFVMAGINGCLEAVKEYDPEKGEFSTYLKIWCKNFMSDYNRSLLPMSIGENDWKDHDKKEEALSNLRGAVSTDTPCNEQGESYEEVLVDDGILSPMQQAFHDDLKEKLPKMMKLLTEQEAFIVKSYYGLDGTEAINTMKIGALLGIAHQTVCVHLDKALKKMKSVSKK